MDCSSIMRSYSRYLLLIFNFIFLLTGIVIITVGLSVKAYFNEFNTLLDEKYFFVSDLLIIIGVIIFFIAFFGCCGALKENACMTSTYSTFLIVIFLLEIAVGIAGILLKNRTEDFVDQALHKSMLQYHNNTEVTFVWDNIQRHFQCCGVDNARDWKEDNKTTGLPISCCPIPPGATNVFTCNETNAYTHGCLEEFTDYVADNISSIEGVSIGLAIIQLLGIVFSCYLSKSIRSDYEAV